MIGALALFAQLAIVTHAPETASTCDAIELTRRDDARLAMWRR